LRTVDYSAFINDPNSDSGYISTVPADVSEIITIADTELGVTRGLPAEWHNILLLGQDNMNLEYDGRADAMIIASINTTTGDIKLCSVLRDFVVELPGRSKPEKLNAALFYGGPNLQMKMINELFGMNIKEYIVANFASFPYIVDAVGGIEIEYVTKDEWQHIHDSVGHFLWVDSVAGNDNSGLDNSFPAEDAYGANMQLTGRQALGYARIRKLDDDFVRSSRQREVLNAIIKKVQSGNFDITTLVPIANKMYPYVRTNISLATMLDIGLSMLKNPKINFAQDRIPIDGSYSAAGEGDINIGSGFYGVDYALNKRALYKFIYGTENP
jgi:LCP family protein required for cell wall assembly